MLATIFRSQRDLLSPESLELVVSYLENTELVRRKHEDLIRKSMLSQVIEHWDDSYARFKEGEEKPLTYKEALALAIKVIHKYKEKNWDYFSIGSVDSENDYHKLYGFAEPYIVYSHELKNVPRTEWSLDFVFFGSMFFLAMVAFSISSSSAVSSNRPF